MDKAYLQNGAAHLQKIVIIGHVFDNLGSDDAIEFNCSHGNDIFQPRIEVLESFEIRIIRSDVK